MFKNTVDTPSSEGNFIQQALLEGLRLDSRLLNEYRSMGISLTRGESTSSAEVTLGGTRVICVVTGSIVQPYHDRLSEGILQINADLSLYASQIGTSLNELRRLMERLIRESDSIDMESLCIVKGQQVWKVICDIQGIDCSGGNMIDCSLFAAMAALRAYRKPDVAVSFDAVNMDDKSSSSQGRRTKIRVFNAMEREPFPLALHHTPLSCSIALFKLSTKKSAEDNGNDMMKDNNCLIVNQRTSSILALVCDPSLEEEKIMDGRIILSMTAHNELCAIHKPGGYALSPEAILTVTRLATGKIHGLHRALQAALNELEDRLLKEHDEMLERYRAYRQHNEKFLAMNGDGDISNNKMEDMDVDDGVNAGIQRDDPMLAWSNLYQPAPLPT